MPEAAVATRGRLIRGVGLPRAVPLPTAVLGVLMVGAAVLLLYAGRHLTFFFDEWNFVLDRRGGTVGTYLDPHNGHLVLFGVAVYKLLMATVGLRHYWPYRAVDVGLDLLCGWLLYVLARRRVGPWLALAPATLLMLMGTAYLDLLWPFQISVLASVAGGLGALALIERPGPRSDVLAAALLAWAVSASGVGIAFLIAAAAMLLSQRSAVRRWWLVALPAVLFVIWHIGWGTSEHVTVDSVLAGPQYVADAAAAAVGRMLGLNTGWGPALALAGLAGLAVAWRRRGAPTPLLLAAGAGALTFWGLAAITRADIADPGASRYLYVGATFAWLAAVEAMSGKVPHRGWVVAVGALLAAGLVANLGTLRSGERALRASDESVRASLGALELAASTVAPGFVPDPANAPQVTAGRYLAAVRDLGSPALSVTQLQRAPEAVRAHVDAVLEQAEGLALASSDRAAPCSGATARGVTLDVHVPPGRQLTIQTRGGRPATLYTRRLARSFPSGPLLTVPGNMTATIRFPADEAPKIQWIARILTTRPILACVR
jgi:hypothetical protein